jgi:hypothetical protein
MNNSSFPIFIPTLYDNTLIATYTNINTASNYIFKNEMNNNICIQITEKLNPSFNVNNQTYNSLNFPVLKMQADLYNNIDIYSKYFHCYNFNNFLSMLQDQIKTINNGVILNYNTSDQTISITVLKSFIDNPINSISFNQDLFNILPFQKSQKINGMSSVVFNKDIIINIDNSDYYTCSCFPNVFFCQSFFIGLKNNPIIPIEICTNGTSITNIQTQELIFMFDIIASGISYNTNSFYANNSTISMYHKFNQDNITSNHFDFEILINVGDSAYSWTLNEGDNLDITLLIYNNLIN